LHLYGFPTFCPQVDISDFVGGGNIDWVGLIVQAVSGEPLDVHFRKHIFEPLGMNDTSFVISPAQWKREMPQASPRCIRKTRDSRVLWVRRMIGRRSNNTSRMKWALA
jgi:CubicO group peptidase (beta-lactamase class C family)